jgi:transcriptional regulator with XRE-family HTH domain
MGDILHYPQRHARASKRSKSPKSSAVTAPPVSSAILSAISRDGQPVPLHKKVTQPLDTPIRAAKSRRFTPFSSSQSASFMEGAFSPSKISDQVKLLAPLHGQLETADPDFGMGRGAQPKRKEIPAAPKQRELQRTFIQRWRKKKGLTQGDVAEYLGVSIATVSQIENAETGYKQEYLEGIAELVGCNPADLLVRSPDDPEPIWELWDVADAAQRKQILRVAKALLAPNGAA